MPKIVDWPTPDTLWWWMRYRRSRRSKWRVLLVRVIRDPEGAEYIAPFQDHNAISRSICTEWEARFHPAAPPPQPWLCE